MEHEICFGKNWKEIISTWYLGTEPDVEEQEFYQAIDALKEHYPEFMFHVYNGGEKGFSIMSHMTALGLMIQACSALKGFKNVLQRIKAGEESALSEAYIASDLMKHGFIIEFEPEINGKRPDLLIHDTQNTYIEIIAPNNSEAINQLFDELKISSEQIAMKYKGRKVDVLLLSEYNEKAKEAIESFLIENSENDIKGVIDDIALISIGSDLENPNFVLDSEMPTSQPMIGFSSILIDNLNKTLARNMIKSPVSDERVKRLISAETHHFSKNESNILIIDISKLISVTGPWIPIIYRCFQPERNTRFGAIILYTRTNVSNGIQMEWSLIINPHAIKPIPKQTLEDIKKICIVHDNNNLGSLRMPDLIRINVFY